MSATMSYGSMPVGRPRWISGVCADIARRAAVSPWIPRAGFVIFGLLHWVLALILYFVLAHYMFRRPHAGPRYAPPPPAARPEAFSGVQERFRHLDERLANLEAATLRSEAELRRAFRDLERK
jgi:phage shock protein PspC (stress-responsive transcriptional regulator)